MTDAEITKRCAKAMGIKLCADCLKTGRIVPEHQFIAGHDYEPLKNDAQAMELVKRFHLSIQPPQYVKPPRWHVWNDKEGSGKGKHTGIANVMELNRAICECVAKMKSTAHE